MGKITALFKAIGGIFGFLQSKNDRQSESEVIRENRRLRKAIHWLDKFVNMTYNTHYKEERREKYLKKYRSKAYDILT